MYLLDLPQEIIVNIIRQLPLGSRYPLRGVNHHLKATIDTLPGVNRDFFIKISQIPNIALVPKKEALLVMKHNPKFQMVTYPHKTGLIGFNPVRNLCYMITPKDIEELTEYELNHFCFQYKTWHFENKSSFAKYLGWKEIASEMGEPRFPHTPFLSPPTLTSR